MTITRFFRRGIVDKPTSRLPGAVTALDFSPASFIWTSRELELHFEVQIGFLRISKGVSNVTMSIVGHELQVVPYITGGPEGAVVELGSLGFIVPSPLRRRGLATAAILASVECFELITTGTTDFSRPYFLGGTFIGDGADFCRAICSGASGTGFDSAKIDMNRLMAAKRQMRFTEYPRRLPAQSSKL